MDKNKRQRGNRQRGKEFLRRLVLIYCLLPIAYCLFAQPTKFGVLVNGTMTTTDKIAIANSLGVKYIRNEIKLEDWTGSSTAYEKFRAKFQVVLNLNWGHAATGAVTFPTNLPVYASKINSVLTKYPTPALVVLENEETNNNYHNGPITDYIAMLDTGLIVVHSKGLKVTNGGIHPQGVCYWVYQDYLDRSLPDSALWWKNETFSGTMLTGLSNPAAPINAYWREIDTLLDAFTTLDLDYVNLHIYEPINGAGGDGVHVTANCIKIMDDYVFARTGKHCITNESGQHNLNDTLVTNMLTGFCNAGYAFAIWFDGDGLPARALNESDGTLRSNGIAFRTFANAYNADSTFCGATVDTSGGGGGDTSSILPPPTFKPYDINADTVRILGRGAHKAELQLSSSTDSIPGFLYNYDSGRVKFKLGIDSVWSAGIDTIKWRYTNGTISYKVVTGGGSTDTTSLSNRINLKVNISDTAAMLLPYLRKTDTTAMLSVYLRKADTSSLSTRINLKLDSVTRSHDSVYAWHNGTHVFAFKDSTGGSFSAVYVPEWAVNDSIAVADTANYSDLDKFLIAVSATGIISGHDNEIGTWHATVDTFSYQTATTGQFLQNAANGYVYQFNGTTWDRTNNKTPIHQGLDSLGAIMNIGTIDSRAMQIRTNGVERLRFLPNGTYRITKDPAAYASGGFKVLGRNTATTSLEDITAQIMKYSDTSSLSTRINLKVNISDTGTMLAPYMRGMLRSHDSVYAVYASGNVFKYIDSTGSGATDTTSLSNRINLKVNISDTGTMLSPYMRGMLRSHDSVYGVYASGNVFKYIDSTGNGFIQNQYASRQVANYKIDTSNARKYIGDSMFVGQTRSTIMGTFNMDSASMVGGMYLQDGSNKFARIYWLDTNNLRMVTGRNNGNKNFFITDSSTGSSGTITLAFGNVTLGRSGGNQTIVVNTLNAQSDMKSGNVLAFTGATKGITNDAGSAAAAGVAFTFTGSNAGSSATNANGGDATFSSGMGRGTGTSNIIFKTSPGNVSSGVLNTAATQMTIAGSGAIRFHSYGAGANTGTPAYNISTDASGNLIESVFKNPGQQTYAGTITWTGGGDPTTISGQTYNWVRIGNMVTLTITVVYSNAGTTNTQVTCTLPADCPAPLEPTSLTAANAKEYTGYGWIDAGTTGNAPATRVTLNSNSGDTGYLLIGACASQSARAFQLTVTYFTN